ncbi:hypothetical protein BSL78_17106 [Apostichopus japonicus]|uniref:Uncharacterized protein n=1 Tax=Stichopus japonicus TaxID=307972 RepID=A0A2G8KDD0_STIJA|nr:hypothetical protein BSL78_17106 [Apostichopus japonicus]
MIALSCLSVLASAVVLRVYHHDPKKPVPKILRFLVIKHKLADVSKPRADTNGAYTNPLDVTRPTTAPQPSPYSARTRMT